MSAWNNPDLLSRLKFWLTWGGYCIAILGVAAAITGEIISGRIDTILHPPLAVRFRALLADINPDIFKAIDFGKRQFSIAVDSSNMGRLTDMMRERGFESVASVQVTGSRIMGGAGNSVGQDFTDLHSTGIQTLCIFTLPHEDAP